MLNGVLSGVVSDVRIRILGAGVGWDLPTGNSRNMKGRSVLLFLGGFCQYSLHAKLKRGRKLTTFLLEVAGTFSRRRHL